MILLIALIHRAAGAELLGRLVRSKLERDLHVGDLRALCDVAFRRIDRPASLIVDRLCERGFLAKTARGRNRMTLKGWLAILLRQTLARRDRTETIREYRIKF